MLYLVSDGSLAILFKFLPVKQTTQMSRQFKNDMSIFISSMTKSLCDSAAVSWFTPNWLLNLKLKKCSWSRNWARLLLGQLKQMRLGMLGTVFVLESRKRWQRRAISVGRLHRREMIPVRIGVARLVIWSLRLCACLEQIILEKAARREKMPVNRQHD